MDQHPRDDRLRKSLLIITAPFVVAVMAFVALTFLTTNTNSDLRAYVQGESRWSSAQKEAVDQLEIYAGSGNAGAFAAYQREIDVPLGDRRARLALDRSPPDLAAARAGFLAGRNQSEDIAGLIRLYRRYRGFSFMRAAVGLWQDADAQIDEIRAAAEQLQASFAPNGNPTAQAALRAAALRRVRMADEKITLLAAAFSAELGAASRTVRTLAQTVIVVLAALLLGIKFLFSWWVLRQHAVIERELRQSEERFELAVQGSSDGIWNWDARGPEVYLSPRALQLLGYPLEDFPREPRAMLGLVHAADRAAAAAAVATMLKEGAALDIELRCLDWHGEFRWVHLRGRPVRIERGRIHRAAGSITDIRERKWTEALMRQMVVDEQQRLEQAQIALLEQVQGRIGRELHDDLGQRLTGEAFLAKALQQRLLASDPVESEQSAWIVNLLNEAIDRVRFLSRQLSPIEIDEISFATALERLGADVRKIFGIQVEIRQSERQIGISTRDANHLFRIAQESISNALRHGQATRIDIRLDAQRGSVRLAVSDNGFGFDPRVNHRGGLGLRNMNIRAHSLHGLLRIRSTKRGTTVIVRAAIENAAQRSTAKGTELHA